MPVHHNQKEIVGDGFRFELGRAIRARRLALQLTQEKASEQTGSAISPPEWCKFERGQHDMKIYQLLAIMQALQLHRKPWQLLLDDLMTGKKHGGHRNEGGTKRRERRAASPYRDDRGQNSSGQDCGEVDKEGTV